MTKKEEKQASIWTVLHDNILVIAGVWACSRVLQIVNPGSYEAKWYPWLGAIILVWGVSQVVIIKGIVGKAKSERNSIAPLGTEELAAYAGMRGGKRN